LEAIVKFCFEDLIYQKVTLCFIGFPKPVSHSMVNNVV
jgi:hypothetical protein